LNSLEENACFWNAVVGEWEFGIGIGVAISFYYKRRTLTNCPWSVPDHEQPTETDSEKNAQSVAATKAI